MNPEPFTYAHFMQALQSMRESMLMFYIDEAVGIYCRIRGKSVGPRPASAKDYSLEYADAFEAAKSVGVTGEEIREIFYSVYGEDRND